MGARSNGIRPASLCSGSASGRDFGQTNPVGAARVKPVVHGIDALLDSRLQISPYFSCCLQGRHFCARCSCAQCQPPKYRSIANPSTGKVANPSTGKEVAVRSGLFWAERTQEAAQVTILADGTQEAGQFPFPAKRAQGVAQSPFWPNEPKEAGGDASPPTNTNPRPITHLDQPT